MRWGRIVILDSGLGAKVFECQVVELLSIIKYQCFGIPNRHMMEQQTKLNTFFSVIIASGSAFAHLVK